MAGGERQFMSDSYENRGGANHLHGLWCAPAHELYQIRLSSV